MDKAGCNGKAMSTVVTNVTWATNADVGTEPAFTGRSPSVSE